MVRNSLLIVVYFFLAEWRRLSTRAEDFNRRSNRNCSRTVGDKPNGHLASYRGARCPFINYPIGYHHTDERKDIFISHMDACHSEDVHIFTDGSICSGRGGGCLN